MTNNVPLCYSTVCFMRNNFLKQGFPFDLVGKEFLVGGFDLELWLFPYSIRVLFAK